MPDFRGIIFKHSSGIHGPYLWHPIRKPWQQLQSGNVHIEAQASKASAPPKYQHNLYPNKLSACARVEKHYTVFCCKLQTYSINSLGTLIKNKHTSRAPNFPPTSGPYSEAQEAISPRFHALRALSTLAMIRMGNGVEFLARDFRTARETW